MPRRALILANGHPPSKRLLTALLKDADYFVCADGGANTAARMKLKPHAIVGDMDSITSDVRARYRRVPFYRSADQDSTDLEKAMQWVLSKNVDRIVVVGALGKRPDHTIGNMGVLRRFSPKATVTMVDESGELWYVGTDLRQEVPIGTMVSLIPLTRCDGVTTEGLQFSLDHETLELGVREGTSNVAVSTTIRVTVESGSLLLYRSTIPSKRWSI